MDIFRFPDVNDSAESTVLFFYLIIRLKVTRTITQNWLDSVVSYCNWHRLLSPWLVGVGDCFVLNSFVESDSFVTMTLLSLTDSIVTLTLLSLTPWCQGNGWVCSVVLVTPSSLTPPCVYTPWSMTHKCTWLHRIVYACKSAAFQGVKFPLV